MSKFAPPTEEDLQAVPPTAKPRFSPPTAEDLAAVPSMARSKFAPPTEEDLAAVPPKKPEPKEGGAFVGEDILPSELEDIAARNKVDVDLLKRLAPYYGASVKGEEGIAQTIGRGFGFVSETLGGLPTFVAKKISPEIGEKEAKALDELNELAQKKKSYLQAGTEMAAGLIVPGAAALKGGKVAASVAAGIEGAAYGLGESKEGEELKMAALGAGVGVAAGPVIEKAAKIVVPAATKVGGYVFKKAKNILDIKPPTKEAADIIAEVEEATKDFVPVWQKQADELFDNGVKADLRRKEKKEVLEIAREAFGVKSKKLQAAVDAIDEARKTLSKEDFQEVIVNQKTVKVSTDKLADLAPSEPSVVTKIRDTFDFAIDFMGVARGIDKRTNVGITDTLLNATENINKYTVELMGYLKKSLPATQTYTKLSDENKALLRRALRGKGEFAKLDDVEKIALLPQELRTQFGDWRAQFSYGLQRANALGVPIKARKDYVPDQMLDPARAAVAIEQRLQKLNVIDDKGVFKGFDEAQFNSLVTIADNKIIVKDPTMQEVMRTAHYLRGDPITEVGELNRIMKQALIPGGDVYVDVLKASALFKREGLMPEYLKETDLRKLSARWGQQTFRYAYVKGDLRKLRMQADLLRNAGYDTDAGKISRLHDAYLGDVRGVAKFTQEVKTYLQTRAFRAAARAETPMVRNFYELLGEAPDAFQNMTLNVYSNFLGLSVRAMVQNLTGGLYMMVPEVGNIYGSKVAVPAYLRAVMKIGKKEYWRELEKQGFVAAQWSTELKEAITRGRPRGVIGQNLDRISDLAMKGFEYSELLNRAIIYESGKEITKDLFKNGKLAKSYLNTMPKSTRNAIERAIANKDREVAGRLVTRYLADRTLFSYNRITQSELSRAVGPLFSMFTKYPSAVAGRAVNVFREERFVGGSVELARFMVAPILAGAVFNKIFLENNPELEELVFGKPGKADAPAWARGMALSSPAFTTKTVLEGRMFTPPLVGIARETAVGTFELYEGNPDRLGRAIKSAVESFAPAGATAFVRAAETYSDIDVPFLGKEK